MDKAEQHLKWEKEIADRLGGCELKQQAGSVSMIPWMKRMAAKYYEKSAGEKEKALTKQNKDKQVTTTFALYWPTKSKNNSVYDMGIAIE